MKGKCMFLSVLLATNVMAKNDTGVTIHQVSGMKNQYVMMTSEHIVDITNTTTMQQGYDYMFTLCPFGEDCVSFKNHVDLSAGQHFVDKRSLQQHAMYHNSGHFPVTATSGAKGADVNANHKVVGDTVIY